MPASRPSSIPNAWPRIEARHAGLRARLAEIDKATSKLVTAIEAGTDPAVINPRLADLRTEREAGTLQLASLDAQNRLSPEIDVLLAELGGLARSSVRRRRSRRRASTTASGSASSTTRPTKPWSPPPTWAVSFVGVGGGL
jgi:hypothetical protein